MIYCDLIGTIWPDARQKIVIEAWLNFSFLSWATKDNKNKKPGTSTTDAQLNEFPFVHSTSFIFINHKEEACSIDL